MAPGYQGHLFSLDPLHNTVTDSERIPQGSTYVTTDKGIAMWSEDVCFRPLYSANAPDGSLFVSDMYEYYIAHGQHYQNQIDPTTGRLYRLRDNGAKLETDTNLEGKTTAQLVAFADVDPGEPLDVLEQLEREPTAGSIYAIELDVPGLPEPQIKL